MIFIGMFKDCVNSQIVIVRGHAPNYETVLICTVKHSFKLHGIGHAIHNTTQLYQSFNYLFIYRHDVKKLLIIENTLNALLTQLPFMFTLIAVFGI